MKKYFHNSRISNKTDTKLRPLTKFDKRNMTTAKQFNNDFVSENFDVIITFLIDDCFL